MTELYEISGTVEHIVYHNENNRYTVMEFSTDDEVITVVGIFPFISKGEDLKIIGEWTYHQNFGNQFKANTFEKLRPKTAAAVLRYLSGGAVKGIGPAIAKKIVDLFGEDTMNVIENEPERLRQIKGISLNKAMEISSEIKRIYGIRELMVYLSKFGIKPEEAVKVWKIYGADSEHLINENPYCLCHDGIGIDFGIADSIAYSMEKPSDNNLRVKAGIIYILKHNAGNGHSCIPSKKLCSTAHKMLAVEIESVQSAIVSMCESNDLICLMMGETEYIYLPSFYQSEMYITDRISLMMKFPPRAIIGIDDEITLTEEQNKIEYAGMQKIAIKSALEKGILILTGGPGTGKTTTLNGIISILKKKGEKVFLAAPTGRAAKRMSELTGEEAKTIHRMLQVEWDENDNPVFMRNEKNPLECDAVIVDELSMVDIAVMEGLLSALPLGCRLILVGDSDQLPSVGAGNVLSDLLNSDIIPKTELKEIFRQSRKSLIVMNSHKIIKGEMPDIAKTDSDFFFLSRLSDEKVTETVTGLIETRLPSSYGFNPSEDIQILCPGRKGALGSEFLNGIIRERINPFDKYKNQVDILGKIFREGDKVMHIKNNYDLPWYKDDGTYGEGVFNGDMGKILAIDKSAGVIKVRIDDRTVAYELEQAGAELEHAYCVTVHKSQGNEFPAVIIPLFKGAQRLKYRNLLYTAITRAKEILIIVGDKSVIEEMVVNDRRTLRYTGLKYMLKGDISD